MINQKIQLNKSKKHFSFMNLKQNSAFTLVEALVAISILMIAIASPMMLAQKGLSTATLSKDQMIAGFLAQDAIEAIKNIRDQIGKNAVPGSGEDWLAQSNTDGSQGLMYNCVCSNSTVCNMSLGAFKFCRIDTTSSFWGTSVLSGNSDLPNISISYTAPDSNGNRQFLKYDYNLGTSPLPSCISNTNPSGSCSIVSKFSRYINIQRNPTDSNPNEAVINVRVSWNSQGVTQNLDLRDYIYNYSKNI